MVDATAEVSLRVPRGEAGDLEAGVAEVIGTVDVVESVRVERVTGMTPTWADIHVDATVELTVEAAASQCPSEDAATVLGTILAEGFGIEEVMAVTIDRTA